MAKKIFEGKIVRKSGDKTVLVEVTMKWQHPRYEKTVHRVKRYLAHDAEQQGVVGGRVRIQESAPISKLKRFRVIASAALGEKES